MPVVWQAGTPAPPAMCLREEASPGGTGLCACSLVSMLWQAETPTLPAMCLRERSKSWWDRPLCLSVSGQRRLPYQKILVAAGKPLPQKISFSAGINPAPTLTYLNSVFFGGAGLCACSLVSMLWQAETPALPAMCLRERSKSWWDRPLCLSVGGQRRPPY